VENIVSAEPDKGYLHIAINSANTVFDQACAGDGNNDPAWNSKIESKVTIEENKCWRVTLAILLKDLDAYVGENLTWTFNLTRSRPARDESPLEESSWAVLPTSRFHQPDAFARLNGVKVVERADGVTRKRDKPAAANQEPAK